MGHSIIEFYFDAKGIKHYRYTGVSSSVFGTDTAPRDLPNYWEAPPLLERIKSFFKK